MNNIDLRDYFAGLAMQGILSNPNGAIQSNSINGWGFVNCTAKDICEISYKMADAMVETRNEGLSSEDEKLFIPTQDFGLDK